MVRTVTQADETLRRITSAVEFPRHYAKCVRGMLPILDLVRAHLPPLAIKALRDAQAYWHGQPGISLLPHKERIWRHMDEIISDSLVEQAALRAVLCVLDEKPATEDVSELLEWFVEFVCTAGGNEAEVVSALERLLEDEHGASDSAG
ncbi:MAG: hypothetical protein U0271_34055 [Polyangiaceae bacterium]